MRDELDRPIDPRDRTADTIVGEHCSSGNYATGKPGEGRWGIISDMHPLNGGIGVLLPTLLFMADGLFLRGALSVRGSAGFEVLGVAFLPT